jgi:hypothetical protein
MASVNCQELQKLIIQVVFQGDLSGLPATFYFGLGTGALPLKDETLADITEVFGPGYSRLALQRNLIDFPSLLLSNDNFKVTSATRRFAALGGAWTAADYAFLTDVSFGTSGRLFAAATLDQPFLNLDGDTWDGTVEWVGSP